MHSFILLNRIEKYFFQINNNHCLNMIPPFCWETCVDTGRRCYYEDNKLESIIDPPEPAPMPPPPPPPPPLAKLHRTGDASKGPKTIPIKMRQKEWLLHLTQAIEQNKHEMVEELVKTGVKLEGIILYSKTPLTYAIELQHFDIAKILIRSGASVKFRESYPTLRQPLHVAAEFSCPDVLELLLLRGADVNSSDIRGATPVMIASFHGHVECVKLLHAYGANLNADDDVGRSVLHRATEGTDDLKKREIVRFLLQNGANINAEDKYRWNAIYHCIFHQCIDTLQCLIENGIDLDVSDFNNLSPLLFACDRFLPVNNRIITSVSMDYTARRSRIPSHDMHRIVKTYNTEEAILDELLIIQLLINAGARLSSSQQTSLQKHSSNIVSQGRSHILHYLLLSGSIFFQNIAELISMCPPELQRQCEKLYSLRQMCRAAIRTHLSTVALNRDVYCSMNRLPLPQPLKDFLNLSDFDELYPKSASRLKQFHVCTFKA